MKGYRGYEEKHWEGTCAFRLRGQNRDTTAAEKTQGQVLMPWH